MKYYLSSYELGNETDKLKSLALKSKIGYIPNARDFSGADPDRKAKRTTNDTNSIREIGLEVELVDLQGGNGVREMGSREMGSDPNITHKSVF